LNHFLGGFSIYRARIALRNINPSWPISEDQLSQSCNRVVIFFIRHDLTSRYFITT